MNAIEEAITEHWGERCPDHEPDCPVCQTWEQWDKLTDEHSKMYNLLRRVRIALMMAGYHDDSQAIDLLFEEMNK